jgi:hypothetical protein
VASDGVGNKFDYTADVASGSDTIGPNNGAYTTNTTYTRAWIVDNAGSDLQKWVRVTVSWQDRAGATQSVNLQSVISRADPISIGTLAVGSPTLSARAPKNRNVNIPYPAISLANGMSAFQPGSDATTNTNPFFVFDNVTGNVLGYCTVTLTKGQSVIINPGGAGNTTNCTTQQALLLSGYIRFVSGNYNQNQVDTVFGNPTGTTKPLSARVEFIAPTPPDPLIGPKKQQCFTQRQKVVSVGSISVKTISTASRNASGITTVTTSGNHNFNVGQSVSINDVANDSFNGVHVIASAPSNTTFTYQQPGLSSATGGSGSYTPTATLVQQVAIPETATAPSGYNAVTSRYVAYTCIVVPLDHDNNPDTPTRWSGQFLITPPSSGDDAWSLGTGNTEFKLCRYTGDYYADDVLSNSEHPLKYRGVTGALDNQNYVVVDGNVACPNDGPANTATGNYVNANTTVHQKVSCAIGTTGCGGQPSGSNNGNASNNGGLPSGAEAETYADDFAFPMYRPGD